jgi:hypothetical protein
VNAICAGSGFWPLPADRIGTDQARCPKCGATVALSKTRHLLAHRTPAVPTVPDTANGQCGLRQAAVGRLVSAVTELAALGKLRAQQRHSGAPQAYGAGTARHWSQSPGAVTGRPGHREE